MSERGRARRVSYAQLELLWERLNTNRDIALGFNKSLTAREYSRRMWEEIATILNSEGNGATKDWKGWCKYWVDYKSKLKKKAVAVRMSQQRTGGGPADIKPLSELESKFLSILRSDFGLGLPGARVEPFDEEEIQQGLILGPIQARESHVSMPALDMTLGERLAPTPSPPFHFVLLTEHEDSSPLPHAAAAENPISSPVASTSRPIAPLSVDAQALPSSPRRRRRGSRREPAMSAEATRRALIRSSDRRAEIEEQRNAILRTLADAVMEMNQILRSRLPECPTQNQ